MKRWLGIDFSGDNSKWTARCTRSNVWIADVRFAQNRLALHSLARVQALPEASAGDPFRGLAAALRAADYECAAIDAPFSVPARYMPTGGYDELLARVSRLPRGRRTFCTGADFVNAIAGCPAPLTPAKPLRDTEQLWRDRGVNVRSTMWVKPRGGAPMTAACLTLLFESARPIWPWQRARPGLIVEAFPAAQLRHWHSTAGDALLPFQGYNGGKEAARSARGRIVDFVSDRVVLGRYEDVVRADADALDATLCAFAAIAVSENRPGVAVPDDHHDEGWVAVHE